MELLALEYPAILQRLATATETPLGEELARALEPSADAAEVAHRQALTSEVIGALRALGGAAARRDPRRARGAPSWPRAAARCPPETLRARLGDDPRRRCGARARDHDAAARRARRRRSSRRSRRSPSRSTARSSRTAPACATPPRPSCGACASELRDRQQRAAEELRRLARSSALRDHLQEDFVAAARRTARLRGARERTRQRAGDRPRRLRLRPDASSSSRSRSSRSNNGTPRWRRRARGGAAHPARAVGGGRRASRRARRARRGDGRDRPRGRARVVSRGWRGAEVTFADEVRLLGARHPLLDPTTAVPIDLELGDAARARDQRPEHGRQDGRAEDARPRRAAPPSRPAPAGRRRRRCRSSTRCSPTSATGSRSR